ncbi:hypothetical protein KORDIASMS9_01637 [Kordia sp. SMS9]|uniref:hypothetical protein n=1 Tax=Kordia sp. SMS9 TaxID=2282170 RepID=UPI000E0D849B|nr:hypothetical protein [Kordia sp. SMS9]AXG69415.1 hypothetical protein KORDIASMS9_01637 [Kordia sp. SMS9]
MKKKDLKLTLHKINVSNLSNIKGGAGPKEVYTYTAADYICCDSIEPTHTQLTTCYAGTSREDCTRYEHCYGG